MVIDKHNRVGGWSGLLKWLKPMPFKGFQTNLGYFFLFINLFITFYLYT